MTLALEINRLIAFINSTLCDLKQLRIGIMDNARFSSMNSDYTSARTVKDAFPENAKMHEPASGAEFSPR